MMNALKSPGLPKNRKGLEESVIKFKTSKYPPNPLSGCVGTLDGICGKIKKPDDELHPALWFL